MALTTNGQALSDAQKASINTDLGVVVTATLTAALATKADSTALISGLASKVDQTAYNTAIALKANSSDVATSLAAKADSTALVSGLSAKVDSSALTTALALKADATALSSGLAGKVDNSALTTALALKADASAVATSLSTKADTSALTSGLTSKVDQTVYNTAIALKANATDLAAKVGLTTAQTAAGATGAAAVGSDGVIRKLDGTPVSHIATAYSTTIPLTGKLYMPDTPVVTAPVFIAGTVNAGGECTIGLIADGVGAHAPTFAPAFSPDPNSDAWNNVAGRLHYATFYSRDGGRLFAMLKDMGMIVGSSTLINARLQTLAKITEAVDVPTSGYTYTTVNTSGSGSLAAADSAVSTQRIPGGQDGYFQGLFTQSDLTRYSPVLTLRNNQNVPAFNTGFFGFYGDSSAGKVNYQGIVGSSGGVAPLVSVPMQTSILTRIGRVGTTGYCDVFYQSAWVRIISTTVSSSSDLYLGLNMGSGSYGPITGLGIV